MLAPIGQAEKHFVQALALHEKSERPFDRGRTALLYGEWLRRERRKRDARIHLSEALHVFDRIGSVPQSHPAHPERAPGRPTALSRSRCARQQRVR
jgi:hypothetical protein